MDGMRRVVARGQWGEVRARRVAEAGQEAAGGSGTG